MKGFTITSFGAAGEVTGSKHLIETPAGSRILLDCGMFQGKREEAAKKNCDFGFDPASIDAVLLSHAHIDHSGLIPKLVKEGFNGKIHTTKGTRDLSDSMLLDSAHIQEEDEKFMKKKKIESPVPECFPLYVSEDVVEAMKSFEGHNYNEQVQITDDINAEFLDAGHVLGSAIILLEISTEEGPKRLVFTGDLGRHDMPILRDPEQVKEADILLCETTYGDRAHEGVEEIEDDLKRIINTTIARKGKVLIPAFALERTQEMILRLESLLHKNEIPNVPIYLDSPLAGRLTQVFEQYPEYYDEEMMERHQKRKNVFSFANLEFTESVEASKELNYLKMPCIIIAGSGMCENGRIRHHLRNHIDDPKTSVMIVGYQAEETLGRKLVEGEKLVRILGRELEVRAEIHVFKSLSAHADMNDLDNYAKSIKGLSKILLVHGEQSSREAFAERLKDFYPDAEVILPEPGKSYELA